MGVTVYEATWTAATRKAHKAAGGYFAGPDETFPLKDASDVADAWGLAGHAANPDQVRANIKRWAKANGHYDALPDTAKDGDDAKESADGKFAPKQRIATLVTRFLRDDAQSKNGRIYPRESVDRLVASAQNSPAMLTCYTSHEAADRNDPIALAGRITRVWREGVDALAQFDIPDTTAGRDMVSLALGGYLKTMSLRAKNAELRMEKGYDLPVVRGDLQLEGIDFAPTPGLPGVAQIQGVALESADPRSKPGRIIDTFLLETSSLMVESAQSNHHDEKQQEANVSKLTEHQLTAIHGHLQEAHGHLHEMCMGGREAGRAFSKANMDKLGAAHDATAKALGVQCRYTPGVQGDNDGDMNGDQAESREGDMTREELLAQLAKEGYTVQAPKSREDQLKEEFEAKLAEQERKFNERLAALATTQGPTPQRQTLVEGATTSASAATPRIYRNGDHIREQLHPQEWAKLVDRSYPWPKDVSPKLALKELGAFLSARLTEREAAMQGIVL